ncbi:MAG: glycosyltransferase [Candidatus Scalindua sp.]
MLTNFSDILFLYGPTWDQPAQVSKHHLARYFSRGRRVLYVENPIHPLSFLTRREEALRLWKRYLNGPIEENERLWVSTFFYPLPYRGSRICLGGQWVNIVNQTVIRPQLLRLLDHLDFELPILFVGCAYALPLIEQIPHSLLVYHCSDDFTLTSSFPASFSDLEEELIRRCDVVITTSEELCQAKIHLGSKFVTVTNGAEIEHFASTQAPDTQLAPELADLPQPIVGYIGSVFEWIDQEWVIQAARKLPTWSFVFIGPLMTDISKLRDLPNIHYLGPRRYEDLPKYLRGFDVTTVPFVTNDVTLRASPIKFYEYLASGVPIVATNLPDFEPLSDCAYLVKDATQFSSALQRAVSEDSQEKRQLRMTESQKYSWEVRGAQVNEIIENALSLRSENQK